MTKLGSLTRSFLRLFRSFSSKEKAASTFAEISDFKPTPTSDLVGFLPIKDSLHFSGGQLEPITSYDKARAYVEEITNADNFIYPPVVHRATTDSLNLKNAKWTEVPKTRRQAHLHRLPPSHFLRLDQKPLNGDLRMADGAFLMHVTGYVFGYRMQFYDWRFDGRVSMSSAHPVYVASQTAASFIGAAYSAWRGWPPKVQKRFTNALYMLGRGPLYECDWEMFAVYYMVFDALYRTAHELHGVTAIPHPKRLSEMCVHYGLFSDQNLFNEITQLRGELFHEALWAGAMPGFDHGGEAWIRAYDLRRICERLIPAMLGYKTQYVATPWNCMGQFIFDPP